MNEYQKEHFDAFRRVHEILKQSPVAEIEALKTKCLPYLDFRKEVDGFLREHFHSICTEKCYQSRLSACCSREGIIAYFADIVINSIFSDDRETNDITFRLCQTNTGFKCIYLTGNGCLWRVKPIVCEMFLCDQAEDGAFHEKPDVKRRWDEYKQRSKGFTWPDRPVLFDDIEVFFMEKGCMSSLMYLNNSPGLLRIKKTAGLIQSDRVTNRP